MKFNFTILLLLVITSALAQAPGGGTRGGQGGARNMNVGHLYGKIVDSKTNKGIEGTSVQLIASRFDTVTKQLKDKIAATVISQPNGDFSLENVPVFGKLRLRITAVGYGDYDQPVSFGLKMPAGGQNGQAQSGAAGGADRMQQMMSAIDKDLGNIKLAQTDATLANVTVTATKPFFEMGVDRKIFNVDKNIVSSGQTATEVMKQIPSVNVDIDGNVTLRNSAPILFVDGRPTTLTLDQIPADIIDKVELITNPSAKFDASSGGGGILNIVLKKNKKTGYNGGIRAGIDSRAKVNMGGDFNYRQGKINMFLSGNYNQRKSKYTSNTTRQNLSTTTPPEVTSVINQNINGVNNGEFAFIRGGFDYFIDNRNTLTLSGSYVHGSFNNNQPQTVDSTILKTNPAYYSNSNVNSLSKADFKNAGGQLSFKHNFEKNGHDITADVNYNSSNNINTSNINSFTTIPTGTKDYSWTQANNGSGYNKFLTIQSDYENPITETTKLEGGVRAAIRNFRNDNFQYYNDTLVPNISSRYKYTDQVYAAYATYSFKSGQKWSYQLGLRVESSSYNGTLIGGGIAKQDTSFKVSYPVSFFPSAYITYKLNDKSDLQLNVTRKINRPNFFQLLPVVNFTDPQNPTVGNPALKPEFAHVFELSYNNNYAKDANFLATAYLKYNDNLITNYLYQGPNPAFKNNPNADSLITYSTYVNANNSFTYGLEVTDRFKIAKIWDMTLNVNLYNTQINNNTSLKDAPANNQRVSWFGKWNNSFKLPKGFSIQFSGDYQARTILPQGGGGGGGRGGMFGGSNFGASQGYINPRYGFDMAVKKDFAWKGGNTLSLILSMNDIFRTQLYSTHAESIYLIQDSERRRDPQVLRLNITYRFGKFDASLFKRKNTKADQGGGADMMGNQ